MAPIINAIVTCYSFELFDVGIAKCSIFVIVIIVVAYLIHIPHITRPICIYQL